MIFFQQTLWQLTNNDKKTCLNKWLYFRGRPLGSPWRAMGVPIPMREMHHKVQQNAKRISNRVAPKCWKDCKSTPKSDLEGPRSLEKLPKKHIYHHAFFVFGMLTEVEEELIRRITIIWRRTSFACSWSFRFWGFIISRNKVAFFLWETARGNREKHTESFSNFRWIMHRYLGLSMNKPQMSMDYPWTKHRNL